MEGRKAGGQEGRRAGGQEGRKESSFSVALGFWWLLPLVFDGFCRWPACGAVLPAMASVVMYSILMHFFDASPEKHTQQQGPLLNSCYIPHLASYSQLLSVGIVGVGLRHQVGVKELRTSGFEGQDLGLRPGEQLSNGVGRAGVAAHQRDRSR